MVYGHTKHDGFLSVAGVNMRLPQRTRRRDRHWDRTDPQHCNTEEEKDQRIENVRNWHQGRNAVALPLSLQESARVRVLPLLSATYRMLRTSRIFRTLRGEGACVEGAYGSGEDA